MSDRKIAVDREATRRIEALFGDVGSNAMPIRLLQCFSRSIQLINKKSNGEVLTAQEQTQLNNCLALLNNANNIIAHAKTLGDNSNDFNAGWPE